MNAEAAAAYGPPRARLSRETVVARALELGTSEGLEAVTLRRLAAELGVTPMALYRHFRDKQDLINAMAEVVLGELDLTAGFKRSMTWSERLRRAMANYKQQTDARPLALPLSIAYDGDGPASFYRMLESLLDILLEAGFPRRQAIVLIRVVSNLLAGYLLLTQQDDVPEAAWTDPRQIDLLRRRFELALLSLPRNEYPTLVDNAADAAEVWLSDPDRWWQDTVDLIVFGLERQLERVRKSPGGKR